MLFLMCLVAVYVVNVGYGFSSSFKKLRDFEFQSCLLNGLPSDQGTAMGNRFAAMWLGSVPVPLPRDYVQGIDRQRSDFEKGGRSYVGGQWAPAGWWYYHLYALAIKTPVATLAMCALAVLVALFRREYSASLAGELSLLVPAIAVIALVSSQTGFSNHMRYTIPAVPFLFVWTSRLARSFELQHVATFAVTVLGVASTVESTLSIYPHSISYFNEFVGGPKNGHWHLLDSNVAWGQDLLYLRKWLDNHPEAKPVRLATFGWIDPRLAGIEFTLPPTGPRHPLNDECADNDEEVGPLPGWYIIDVNFLHGTDWPTPTGNGTWREIPPNGLNYEYFQRFEPVDRVAYSYLVYHITLADANTVRAELHLPLINDPTQPEIVKGVED
jgi:hypothetical protein